MIYLLYIVEPTQQNPKIQYTGYSIIIVTALSTKDTFTTKQQFPSTNMIMQE